tara:strand:- start:232 stop:426 length:195 start_codon:yes stop_codon:yes gene_type:complete
MYLIIQETKFDSIDNIYQVINFTNDIEKANDMLQGYNLINKQDNVIYTLVKYEQPLKLTKEMEC